MLRAILIGERIGLHQSYPVIVGESGQVTIQIATATKTLRGQDRVANAKVVDTFDNLASAKSKYQIYQ